MPSGPKKYATTKLSKNRIKAF